MTKQIDKQIEIFFFILKNEKMQEYIITDPEK